MTELLQDQSSLPAAVTRALNLFRAAYAPADRWGDYLAQARAITQERGGQIATRVTDEKGNFRFKNKAPYCFTVPADLLGLRGPASPTGNPGYPR